MQQHHTLYNMRRIVGLDIGLQQSGQAVLTRELKLQSVLLQSNRVRQAQIAAGGRLSRNRRPNRNLKTSKALPKAKRTRAPAYSRAQRRIMQRGFPKGWSREDQVRFPKGQKGTEQCW